ncbi:hypothetical protein KAS14_01970 [Candidatus Bathyarchaeota archaeon]|nr:hypothetical protein [Candidatus Bathyarchaeota archaeon]
MKHRKLAIILAMTLLIIPNLALLPSVNAKKTPKVLTVVSDDSTEWSVQGTNHDPAVECWSHPEWGSIDEATWVWISEETDPAWEYENVPDGGWYFYKIFHIPIGSKKIIGTITLNADNAFELYVNDEYIGGDGSMNKDGPDSGECEWKTPETFEITESLKPGKNIVTIRAINHHSHGSSTDNPAGLTFKISIFEATEWK